MRWFTHWTPRYFLDKLCFVLYELTHPSSPWLTAEATKRLDAWLQPTFTGVEWGAGRSTLWFAQRVAHLTSIEHDAAWYRAVQRKLERRRITNVTLLLHPANSESYVDVARTYRDGSLDFALVDGRQRDRCALAVIPKIRPGGWLIVDNINRYLPSNSRSPLSLGTHDAPLTLYWEKVADQVAGWHRTWTTNGIYDTVIWQRP